MIWVLLIIVLLYTILIGGFVGAHWRVPRYSTTSTNSFIGFSLIIPFRNEANNLPILLEAIGSIDYPIAHYEVLLINDDSQDSSLSIIKNFIVQHPRLPISCLQSVRTTGSPKKDALLLGIQHATCDWILTTDADCTFPETWLHTLNSFVQDKCPKMIVGPVAIKATNRPSFLNAFEQLDFLSLMGATIGGFGIQMPFLCNGAHLAYEKKAFHQVNGFSNNNHIASGDDHFLLEKFNQNFPNQVAYLKTPSAIITTQQQTSWKQLISQRVRWASKSKSYTFWFSKAVGILVFVINLISVISTAYILFYLFGRMMGVEFALANLPVRQAGAHTATITLLLLCLMLKYIIDYFLIARTASFFDRKQYLKWYPIIMVSYPFITLYIALLSLTSTYKWKGRRFKQ